MTRQLKVVGTALVLVGLVLAWGTGAGAAGKIGAKQIKAGAIKTAKIQDGAVTGRKIADGTVTASKLAAGAVTAGKLTPGAVGSDTLADGSVTGPKLDPGARADGYRASYTGAQINMAGNVDTVVLQRELPAPGSYHVTISAQLAPTTANIAMIDCVLLDGSTILARAISRTTAQTFFQDTATLAGFSDGGGVALRCRPDLPAAAGNIYLTAVRVASVTELPAAP